MFGFWFVYTLIALPCILYTGHALTAHTGFALWLTTAIYMLLTGAWFAMALIWNLRTNSKLSVHTYTIISQVGYFMLGFAFLLLCALFFRDMLWLGAYLLTPFKIASPFEAENLIPANLWTLGIVTATSIYAAVCAAKMPRVEHYQFTDSRIIRPLKILAVSDLHINKTVSPSKVRKYVKYLNAVQADIILLVGDIADDFVQDVAPHLRELKNLSAKYGIYATLGNHEVYYNALQWESAFAGAGWQVLHNSGVSIEDTGIFIGGVPSKAGFSPNPQQALHRAATSELRILLAHEPQIARLYSTAAPDIQISGHTHGGQIFPFHFPVKWGNSGFVSGAYQFNNTMVLVSNGASYWGPPMRLFAPNNVLLIELKS